MTMPTDFKGSDAPSRESLSVAVLDFDEQRRKASAAVLSSLGNLYITEIPTFPLKASELAHSLTNVFNIILLNVDCDADLAYELVQELSASSHAYVMAYSSHADMKQAVHLMRAGASEFLTAPIDMAELAPAIERAAEHSSLTAQASKEAGRLFVFLGTKGGVGVTTLAANFALALAQESAGKTLLMDFGLPLGDVAINLGIKTEYTLFNALQFPERLDGRMLTQLVAKHSTGLSVLASPSEFHEEKAPSDSVDKLVSVASEAYSFVVADIGSRVDLLNTSLFEKSAVVYLVTQVGITELLNANRMITKFFFTRDHTLQVVLNRYRPSDLLFDERKISEVLTRPPQWKVPDDYAAARRTRETATPMVLIDSPIARTIREMARTASGAVASKIDRKRLFGFLR